jgi:hypothetical protein
MIPADLKISRRSYARWAALAAENIVKVGGIPKDHRLVNGFGTRISRRHLVSFGQSGYRPGLQIIR